MWEPSKEYIGAIRLPRDSESVVQHYSKSGRSDTQIDVSNNKYSSKDSKFITIKKNVANESDADAYVKQYITDYFKKNNPKSNVTVWFTSTQGGKTNIDISYTYQKDTFGKPVRVSRTVHRTINASFRTP